MATGEQFIVMNPSVGLFRGVLVQLAGDTTLHRFSFTTDTYNSGGLYASDGSVTEQANFAMANAYDFIVSMHAQAATAMVDQSFFIAPFPVQVSRIDYVHAVAEVTAAAMRIQVTKDVSTDAPGAGTDLLTNNTNAGFNGNATANTVQNGTLTATLASLQLAAGNRLSVDFSNAATELVGVTINVYLIRI